MTVRPNGEGYIEKHTSAEHSGEEGVMSEANNDNDDEDPGGGED